MAPAAYVTEDVLVGHQWKEKPLVLPSVDPQCREMSGRGGCKGVWLGMGNPRIEEGDRNGIGDFWPGNQGGNNM